jgi:hypothetical protein
MKKEEIKQISEFLSDVHEVNGTIEEYTIEKIRKWISD